MNRLPGTKRLMDPAEFKTACSKMKGWIDRVLADYKQIAKRVDSFPFSRLRSYFSAELLHDAKVVIVKTVPIPPLSAMGFSQFRDFENHTFRAMTFLDTYFIADTEAWDEVLHVHELVHVVQWKVLGPEPFLMLYAHGVEQNAEYRANPLEEMAYRHQKQFTSKAQPYSIEETVTAEIDALLRTSLQA